jgi:ADP-heptose:LPS heptosyltransferase
MFLALVEALTRPARSLPTMPWAETSARTPEPEFRPAPEERAKVERLVRETTGLAPCRRSCAERQRERPAAAAPRGRSRYAELARGVLDALPDAHVVFTGSPAKPRPPRRWRRASARRAVTARGPHQLRELCAVHALRGAGHNDSGPAHFATLTPVSVVTLFGPETPTLFGARTPRNSVVYAGLACSPCVNALNNRQTTPPQRLHAGDRGRVGARRDRARLHRAA